MFRWTVSQIKFLVKINNNKTKIKLKQQYNIIHNISHFHVNPLNFLNKMGCLSNNLKYVLFKRESLKCCNSNFPTNFKARLLKSHNR